MRPVNGLSPHSRRPAERQLRSILASLPHKESFLHACRYVDDWGALVSSAQAHGVDGVLVAGARNAGLVPQHPAWDVATRRMRRSTIWRDVLHKTLHDVLASLDAHGIAVVTLKGPVLATRLYDDEVVRPSTDLDLLVEPSSLEQAAVALKPLGYALEGGEIGRFFRNHHHHVHFTHRTLPTLELHFDAYRGFGTSLAAAPLLARSTSCAAPVWSKARVLAPEDEFLYLAVHAASHRFERLVWLYDLKLLALRQPDLRWDLIAERARTNHLSAVVSFACTLLSEELGAPRYADRFLRPLGEARRLAARHLVLPQSSRLVNGAAHFAFCTLLCDDGTSATTFLSHYLRVKLLHEGPRRLRSGIMS